MGQEVSVERVPDQKGLNAIDETSALKQLQSRIQAIEDESARAQQRDDTISSLKQLQMRIQTIEEARRRDDTSSLNEFQSLIQTIDEDESVRRRDETSLLNQLQSRIQTIEKESARQKMQIAKLIRDVENISESNEKPIKAQLALEKLPPGLNIDEVFHRLISNYDIKYTVTDNLVSLADQPFEEHTTQVQVLRKNMKILVDKFIEHFALNPEMISVQLKLNGLKITMEMQKMSHQINDGSLDPLPAWRELSRLGYNVDSGLYFLYYYLLLRQVLFM